MLAQCPQCKAMHSVELRARQATDPCCAACRKAVAVAGDALSGPAHPAKAPIEPEVFPFTPAAAVSSGVARPVMAEPDGLEPALWQAWRKVLSDWHSPLAHDAFVRLCVELNALAFAGARYREHLQAHPADPVALLGRDHVLTQAMAPATVHTNRPAARRR